MARTADALRERGLSFMPAAFRGLDPLVALVAGPLAEVETAAETMASYTVPSTSEGAWLELIGEGIGLRRKPGELDDALKARIASTPQQVTPAALTAAADAVLDAAAEDPSARYERQNATWFAADDDSGADEGLMELFADGESILIGVRQAWFVVPDLGADEGLELAVCGALARARAAGVSVRVIYSDTFSPPTGLPWDLP